MRKIQSKGQIKNFLHFALKFGMAKKSLIPLNFLIEMRFFETSQIFWAEKNSEITRQSSLYSVGRYSWDTVRAEKFADFLKEVTF